MLAISFTSAQSRPCILQIIQFSIAADSMSNAFQSGLRTVLYLDSSIFLPLRRLAALPIWGGLRGSLHLFYLKIANFLRCLKEAIGHHRMPYVNAITAEHSKNRHV